MRALFLLVVVLLLAVLGWLCVSHADAIYCRMVLNKAIHEYSTKNPKQAIERATALLERSPRYTPALEQTILWLGERKEFARARELAHDYATTTGLSAHARYQLAICAYETGRDDEATSLLASLDLDAAARNGLPRALIEGGLAVAARNYESALLALDSVDSQFTNDLFYHSLMGRTYYARDDIDGATAELTKALELGERNPRARLYLAVCRSQRGDTPGMERLLDELHAEGLDAYELAYSEIGTRLQRFKEVRRYVSRRQHALHEDATIHLGLALAAIDGRRGEFDEARARYAALVNTYPGRVGLSTRLGIFLEPRASLQSTIEAYASEGDRLLLAAYKLILLDPYTTETLNAAFWNRFLPQGSQVFDAQSMEASVGKPSIQGWNLFASGSISTTFTLTSTGHYAFGMIGRGEEAAGIWPIVIALVDGQSAAELYVSSPVLDYYEFHHILTAGEHSVRFYYLNNAVPEGVEGDRNFILDKVIVRPEPN